MTVGELWEVLTWAERLSVIAVLVGLPAATYYPFMFAKVRFWESDIGKSMFMKGMALMLILWAGIGTLIAMMKGWGWYEWLRAVLNWFLVVAVTYQVIVMRRVQSDGEIHEKMGVTNDRRTDS